MRDREANLRNMNENLHDLNSVHKNVSHASARHENSFSLFPSLSYVAQLNEVKTRLRK